MATRYTAGVNSFSNTDGNYRIWVNEFILAILAMGWVQTADTGQINPATVVHPTGNNTSGGYAIFRMADALQAAAPVFMRVNFATGSGSTAGNSQFQIQFGTGTNGAGTLTGLLSDQFIVSSQFPSALDCYTSGSTNRFSMAWWLGAGSFYSCFFSVERTKNADGTDNTDGLLIQAKSAQSITTGTTYVADLCQYQAFMFYPGALAGSTAPRCIHTGSPAIAHGNNASGSSPVGPDTPIFPWRMPSGRGVENEPVNMVSYNDGQIVGNLTEFDAYMYGTLRHYKAFSADVGLTVHLGGASPTAALVLALGRIAMRWE